ncbi:hypothetical protein F5B18DRAFT_645798 [Nemania serpens]|nr:hypothetical protein F5B18DRAFT_645798 [Nemania serpens]
MALGVEAGPSRPIEPLAPVHTFGYHLPRSVPVRLRAIAAERGSTRRPRHLTTTMSSERTRGVVADRLTAVTPVLMILVEGKLRLLEMLTLTPASDTRDPHRRGTILGPFIIRNIREIVRFRHHPGSGPEAEAHCHFHLLDLNDPSVNANATAAVAPRERSALNGIIQRGTDRRDLTAHTLLADVLYPHVTTPPTVGMLNEASIQMILLPAVGVRCHLGRPTRRTVSPNRLVHASTLRFEIQVALHGLPPAVPHSHAPILLLDRSHYHHHHPEVLQISGRILVGRPLPSRYQELIMLLARPKITPLADLERRLNIATSLDWQQAGHLLLGPIVLRWVHFVEQIGETVLKHQNRQEMAAKNISTTSHPYKRPRRLIRIRPVQKIELFLFLLVLQDVNGAANLHLALQQVLWLKSILGAVGFLGVPSGVGWLPLVVV